MEFLYRLPNKNEIEPKLNIFSPEVTAALSRKAIDLTQAENLVGKEGSPEVEKFKSKIEAQSTTSLAALGEVINQINKFRPADQLEVPTIDEFRDVLDVKMDQWQKDGSLDWCNGYEKFTGEFKLLATPNILVSPGELMCLAKAFGEDQNPPKQTGIKWGELYNRYSPSQLSGKQNLETINGVIPKLRFSLIPTSLDPNLYGTVEEQKEKLLNLQNIRPNLQVPSPLDAVVNWHNLTVRGEDISELTTLDRTSVSHFDLPIYELDAPSYSDESFDGSHFVGPSFNVPFTFFDCGNKPCLSRLPIDSKRYGRVAVG